MNDVQRLGRASAWLDGDDSGTVGPEDLAIWKDHFGEVAASSAAVPEPSSLLLLLTLVTLLTQLQQRR